MLVVLTETYCNKVNIQITQWDDFIQTVVNLIRLGSRSFFLTHPVFDHISIAINSNKVSPPQIRTVHLDIIKVLFIHQLMH